MADKRYHVSFRDDAAGTRLGLLLVDTGQIGYSRQVLNPYAAKTQQGDTRDSDLTEWSLLAFSDWRGGRGQETLAEGDRAAYYDAGGVETRIRGQVTLGPLPHVVAGTVPQHVPGSVREWLAGYLQGYGMLAHNVDRITKTGRTYSQRFGPVGDAHYGTLALASVKVYGYKYAAGEAQPLTVAVYSDSSGAQPDIELVSKDVAAAGISTSAGWITATFTTPLVMTPNTWYHVVVSSSGTYAISFAQVYDYYPVLVSAGGGVWVDAQMPSLQLTYELTWAAADLAQSFVGPTGGLSASRARLWLRRVGGDPGTYTVNLCADSSGSPGSVLKAGSVTGSTVSSEGGWVEVAFTAQALTEGTTYWLTLEAPGTVSGSFLLWGADPSGGYASGAGKYRESAGAWAALTYGGTANDLYFQVEANELDGSVVAFARFNSKWYVAAGDTVYQWNNTTGKWETSEERSGKTVTSLAVWGGYLWVARGTADNVRTYSGSAWAEAAGPVKAQLLYAGGPAGGWLHRTNPTAGSTHTFYYTADGTTWSDTFTVGSSDYSITGMAWFGDMLVLATPVGLFGFAAEIVYQLLDWRSQEDADNGKAMVHWSKTGALYINLRFGLYRWNGDTMVAVGPEQGTGLPAGRVGKVTALVGTNNWLYAGVDAGASGTSSILAYNGMGGWHEVVRADEAGERIQAVGFETLHTPSHLWYNVGDETRYLYLPDYSDNPYQWTGYEFVSTGELVTSWAGSELMEVVKDLHEVIVRGDAFATGQRVDIEYEVDRSGRWTRLGTIEAGARAELVFPETSLTSMTLTGASTVDTLELASGSTTTEVREGDWLRINGEVRQVASVTDSDTLTLETALTRPPSTGDVAYGARPAGREFRLRLKLRTISKTATPRVTGLAVRYQNNVLDRFAFRLQIQVRDGLSDLAGAAYPLDAASLRSELDQWCTRVTPFVLEDPDGRDWRVKVSAAGEGGWERDQTETPGANRYRTVYNINLVEVG